MLTRPLPALRPPRAAALACAAAIALAGCTEEGLDDGSQSGGGAGDEEADLLLAAFVGVYDLTGPWRGDAGDVAYLVIDEPDGGEAEVRLHDVDEGFGNCFERPTRGVARFDDFTGRVFLDDFPDFDAGTLSLLDGGDLAIDYTDTFDLDGDGDRAERPRYVAPRFDQLAEADFGPDC